MVRQLRQNYPNLSTFTQRGNQSEAFLALEAHSMNTPAGLELMNKFV